MEFTILIYAIIVAFIFVLIITIIFFIASSSKISFPRVNDIVKQKGINGEHINGAIRGNDESDEWISIRAIF